MTKVKIANGAWIASLQDRTLASTALKPSLSPSSVELISFDFARNAAPVEIRCSRLSTVFLKP